MASRPESGKDGTGIGQLGRASVVYGLGTLISRAASFIMLPVYTRLLTPSDYGLIQMLDITMEVMSLLLSAGATAGVMRFYYKATDSDERRRVLGTALVMLLTLNVVGSVVIALMAPWIIVHLLDETATPLMVFIAAANFTVGSVATVPLLYVQMRQNAVAFTILSVGRLVVQLTLNIVFLVVFELGPLGILLSSLVASSVTGAASLAIFVRDVGIRVSPQAWRDLRSFAVPYQFTAAGTFLLTFGNRYFIRQLLDLEAVGLFGLAGQFGFLLAGLTYVPILRAWTPQRHAQAPLPADVRDRLFNRDALLLSIVTVAGATGAALFVEPFLRIMSDPAFLGAASIAPILVVAYVFQGWSEVFMFNFDIGEKPVLVSYGTWITVAVLFALLALLIPVWGTAGAAFATLAAFGVRLAVYWGWSRRVWHTPLLWKPHARLLCAGLIAYTAYRLLAPSTAGAQIAIATTCFVVFAVASAFVLPADIRQRTYALGVESLARAKARLRN